MLFRLFIIINSNQQNVSNIRFQWCNVLFLFDLIRLHPQMGYELLSKWDSTRPYAEAALYHHLWYDEKGGYPREYTYKGNDNAILYQILTCADCLDAATDSVGRLITAEREQLYREVFGKNVELVL